jgi:hypothetical protein
MASLKDVLENTKAIYMTDSALTSLMDFERVVDELDVYVFENWKKGELAEGPVYEKYFVTCTFMWPESLMPDPRGAKRLLPLGCDVKFKKTTIKVPVTITEPDDYKPGTHYPKLTPKKIWLVNITIPKDLMNDIREGSVDLAEQTIDMEDLEDAYAKDYDTEGLKDEETQSDAQAGEESPDSGLPGLGL